MTSAFAHGRQHQSTSSFGAPGEVLEFAGDQSLLQLGIFVFRSPQVMAVPERLIASLVAAVADWQLGEDLKDHNSI